MDKFDFIGDVFVVLVGLLCLILAITQITIAIMNEQILPILVFAIVGYFGASLIKAGVDELTKGKE